MTLLAILEYPDPRLRIKARPVTEFDASLGRLIDDMLETMYASRGIGLAATQVNVHRRVLVLDVSGNASAPRAFVNPRIVSTSLAAMSEERCLSVPGIAGNVPRAARLQLQSVDRHGAAQVDDAEGLLAVCIQHEMDHLEGRLFVDRLSLWRRLSIGVKARLAG